MFDSAKLVALVGWLPVMLTQAVAQTSGEAIATDCGTTS